MARSSAVQASSSRRQKRRWAIVCVYPQTESTVGASSRLPPSPHHCFRTAHLCAQSVKGSPIEPVLSRSSRQRLGHLQSQFDGGWHVYQAVFPEPQSAAACRRVERRDFAHEALPRLQSANIWFVMEQLVSGVCRLSSAFHVAGNSPPVMMGDTGQ